LSATQRTRTPVDFCPRTALFSTVLCLIFLATASVAEVPVVKNGDQPAEGPVTATLQEMWRIGGEDDEENLLGVVNQALTDDEGNVYLLDIQLVEVQVFDPEGLYLRSLGKRGDGPGEVRNAFGTLFLPDGNLGLIQGFPGRIVKVDLEGLPAGEMRPGGDDPSAGGFFVLRSSAVVGSQKVLGGMKMTRGDNTRTADHFIATYNLDGSESVRYVDKTTVRDFGRLEISEKDEFFPLQGGWALGPDGRVYVGSARNEYRIDIYGPEGGLEKTITREYESCRRTSAETERARELMMPRRRRNRNAINVVVEPTERDILSMRVDPEGQLWVLPSRGTRDQAEGIHSTWDVFDSSGSFVQQVAFACEGDGQKDALFFPGNGLAVLVREHTEAMFAFLGRGAENPEEQDDDAEARPMEVICYKILP
jgi:hypothetical protein